MRDFRIGRLKGRFVVMWNDDDGRRRRYRLEAHTAKEAEREARNLIVSRTAPKTGVTVAQLWDAYRADRQGRAIAAKMAVTGKHILPVFGHLLPSQITADDCRKHIAARRAAGAAEYTIHTEMGNLRICLSWAAKTGLIPRAPAIERPQTPAPRDRYLTREEAMALIDAAHAPHIRLAIQLMLMTAGRIGALLELTWDRVDMQRGIIRLATNDIGPRKGRATVPMTDGLRAALTVAAEAARSDYVIEHAGEPVASIKTGFNAAVKRAGIAHCTPHDLRRTAGRFMVENGTPIEEVAAFLGHSNPSVTRSTYAAFSPTFLRGAASALEFGGPRLVRRTDKQRPKEKLER